ncbi:MAG: hypothetical protein NWR72_15280 [Bacteroidia bacterium]|nr:hypothetical protein [Bacteroidia bacterium]
MIPVQGQEKEKLNDFRSSVNLTELKISSLGQQAQRQFKTDLQLILSNPTLKTTFADDSDKLLDGFTGTEEEKTRLLATLARKIVTTVPASADPETTAPISNATVSGTELTTRPTVFSKVISVSANVLSNKPEEMQISNPDDPQTSGPKSTDPLPMNPGKSQSNSFRGQISYEIPDTMQVNQTNFVRLVIAVDPSIAEQLASRGEGSLKSDEIGIGKYMKAELLDYDSFDDNDKNFLTKLWQGSPVQIMDLDNPKEAIVWEWTVRPLKPGNHILGVKVSIILYDEFLPNKEGYKSLDTYEKPIRILAQPKVKTKDKPSPLTIAIGFGVALVLMLGAFFLAKNRRTKTLRAEAEQENLFQHVQEGDGKADPLEIKALIKAGEFDKAAGELMDLAKLTQFTDSSSIIAMQARINHWQNDVAKNIISSEEARQERSKITLALLHLLEEIGSQSNEAR